MNKDEITHLAKLARLSLTEEESKEFAEEVESVLSYVSDIKEAVGEFPETPESGVPFNVMREDEEPHEAGLHTKTLLSSSKNKKGDYIKVKKIFADR
ncbi:MAG: Asp-tRNA(Asn)/Glu-tRNA(Gln) amidotransferase subunit GatC [Candidatus Paceibacterota bacterium]